MSRTRNLIRNVFFGLVGKVFSILLSFISRTVFIFYIGKTYLGISGLYTEVLSVLSVAELGIGSALIYAMYAPVAQKDEEKTLQLLEFYRTAYRIVAGAITVIGLCLLPFLQYIVQGADIVTLFDLRLYYLLYLCNTVSSYFVTYKYSYVNALQKNYIVTNLDTVINMAIVCAQIIVILVTHNFLAYLLTQIGLQLLSRVAVAFYLNRRFPILKKRSQSKLPEEERKSIYQNIKKLAVGQFASAAIHSTDNIIISSLSGLGVVGVALVGNYTLFITSLQSFVIILFNSVASGFGNLAATSSAQAFRKVFEELNFLCFWLYGFCSTAFFVLIPPFITLWLGKEFLIDYVSFALIVLNFYLQGQSSAYAYPRAAKGNFGVDLWPSVVQPIVNLVVSIVCAKMFGLVGVYIGTVASRLVYSIRPLLGYRILFDAPPSEYYKKFFLYLGVVAAVVGVTWLATYRLLQNVTIGSFIAAGMIVAILPNAIFGVFFWRSGEFKSLIGRMKSLGK